MVVDPEYAPVNGRKRSQRPQRPQRTHREVADELRARIRSGELSAGRRMPTQARLAGEFGVERGTVRQALRILQSERLLGNVSKGAPATVAVCLTAMSLTLAIGEPLRQIHAGRLKPAKVDVRVLLPGRDIDLAFPVAVEGRDDGHAVHERWLSMRNAQGQVLRHDPLALRATHGIDVRVSFRALPSTPPVKLYLLNGTEVLFAFGQGTGTRDATFVEQSRLWFDALRGAISSEPVLTD
ncbi:winged helix-turn-helix domain-containing protein [Streptomyces sp. NPDC001812]|uniref:winged helix-turn-helix domain-containing protein n=1 Tax=Streptomyces sp. NPDC001812 TaxID=3364611 RepID=UPI0036A98356